MKSEVSDGITEHFWIDHFLIKDFEYRHGVDSPPTISMTFYAIDGMPAIDPLSACDEAKPVAWFGKHSGYTWHIEDRFAVWFPANMYLGEPVSHCVWELLS